MQVSLPRSRYTEPVAQAVFFDRALEHIEATPGVQAVGFTQDLPFSGSRSASSFAIEGTPESPSEDRQAYIRSASPDYFRAMGIPLLRGRGIEPRDTPDSPLVIVINETMARRFWPDTDPIGEHLLIGPGEPLRLQVVGVVGDIKHMSLETAGYPEMYIPYRQRPMARMFLAIRSEQEPRALFSSVRSAVMEIDPDLPVFGLRRMTDRLDQSIAPQRMSTMLLTVFAAVALILALIGVYGVISHGVAQRTHEIGIRMALGARQADVLRMVTRQGLRLTAVCVLLGLGAAAALTRLLASLLFGVSASDPVTFIGAATILMAAALLASYLPARRASRLDPMAALRHE